MEYMKKMIDDSSLVDKLEPERDASIDYLQAYRLVDTRKIDAYARAFVVEDDNKTGILKYEVCVEKTIDLPLLVWRLCLTRIYLPPTYLVLLFMSREPFNFLL